MTKTAPTVRPIPKGKDRARPPKLDVDAVKALVRHRDGYRCRICGMTAREHVRQHGRSLDVHRIKPGSRYTVRGCIAVCRDCHYQLPRSAPGTRTTGGCVLVSCRLVDSVRDALKRFAADTKRTWKAAVELAVETFVEDYETARAAKPRQERLWPKITGEKSVVSANIPAALRDTLAREATRHLSTIRGVLEAAVEFLLYKHGRLPLPT